MNPPHPLQRGNVLYKALCILAHEASLGLGTLLRRLVADLDGGMQQIYDRQGAGFRPRYFPIAQYLLRHGPTAISQLSRDLDMTQPAVSQTVKEMVRDGLLELAAGDDRRVKLVSFTAHGHATCRQLAPVWAAAQSCSEELGREVGIDLSEVLKRLIAVLEQRPYATRIEEKLQ